MTRFGGNEFTGFSVPIVFEGRYFIMEPGNPPLLTVVYEKDGEPFFEVLKNEPHDNPVTETIKSATGIVTVSDKSIGKFLYKIRPGSETSVVFGKIDGSEITVRINDNRIQVGGITLKNNTFGGDIAGIVVKADGGVAIGSQIPPKVRGWLNK